MLYSQIVPGEFLQPFVIPLHYEPGSGDNRRISDVLQKMGSVLSGHFTRGLAAVSTPTMLESSASLMGSSSETRGLYQRWRWTSALGGRNMVTFSSWTLTVQCLKIPLKRNSAGPAFCGWGQPARAPCHPRAARRIGKWRRWLAGCAFWQRTHNIRWSTFLFFSEFHEMLMWHLSHQISSLRYLLIETFIEVWRN